MRLILSGFVDGGVTAVLHTVDHIEIRIPAFLVPDNTQVGTVLDLNITVDRKEEHEEVGRLLALQENILSSYKRK